MATAVPAVPSVHRSCSWRSSTRKPREHLWSLRSADHRVGRRCTATPGVELVPRELRCRCDSCLGKGQCRTTRRCRRCPQHTLSGTQQVSLLQSFHRTGALCGHRRGRSLFPAPRTLSELAGSGREEPEGREAACALLACHTSRQGGSPSVPCSCTQSCSSDGPCKASLPVGLRSEACCTRGSARRPCPHKCLRL